MDTRTFWRGVALLAAALLLLAGIPAAYAATFSFELSASDSKYLPQDGMSKSYEGGTAFRLELPMNGGTIQSGAARITDFSLPPVFYSSIRGIYFEFTSWPSVIVGNVSVSEGQAEITFPSVTVDFKRGSNSGNASPGTLVLELTTLGTTIPGGCAGRGAGGEFIPGIPLDLTTGELGLVASVCPYEVDDDGAPLVYDNAFRLALSGTVVGPEPERPSGTYPPIHVADDPLYGGHYQLDESVGGGRVTGEFVIKGGGGIEGDLAAEAPGCTLDPISVTGSVLEIEGVVRLKILAPVSGLCLGQEVSGNLKIKGELDSDGLFGGTITLTLCTGGSCERVLQDPFFFDLGAQQGGPWDLVITDVVKTGKTATGEIQLGGECTLKPDRGASADWLEFNLTGTYDKATGRSKIKCKGNNSFSQGAKIKLKNLFVSGGEVISGRIVGKAFGQQVWTPVPDAGPM